MVTVRWHGGSDMVPERQDWETEAGTVAEVVERFYQHRPEARRHDRVVNRIVMGDDVRLCDGDATEVTDGELLELVRKVTG